MGRFSRPIFDTSISLKSEAVHVTLRGELDLATVPLLDRELVRAEAFERPLLLLDVGDVTFIDGAGMKALLETARRGARRGTHVRVANPSAPIRRLFQLTAIDQSVEVIPA